MMMNKSVTLSTRGRNDPSFRFLFVVVTGIIAMTCCCCIDVVDAQETIPFNVEHTKLLPIGFMGDDSNGRTGSTTNTNDNVKPNSVMIMLTEKYDQTSNIVPIINRLLRGTGGSTVAFYYNNTIKGASITNITPSNIVKLLNKPAIKYGSLINTASINGIQKNPVWGLDRIDQTTSVLDKQYTYNATGRGVTAYIIDTGILPTHEEFDNNRASCEFSSIPTEDGCVDLNGHGTHVAGTIGGKNYGVAKRVKLVGIKVLDAGGSGSFDGVVAGIDYVTGLRKNGKLSPMVINMSLGGGKNEMTNLATNAAAQAGITVVVAAGNSGDDTCEYSPASSEKAIAVGATELTGNKDELAYFSNHGKCVEILAPGVGVKSSWYECDTCTETLDGTSMASPHVCGVSALLLEKYPYWKPHQVNLALTTSATKGSVTGIKKPGTPNLLLNMAGL